MKFTAIDVETANADMASICSIGAAVFENGKLASEWHSLVNPDDEFDFVNISIHGIDQSMVAGSPTFGELSDTLNQILSNAVVVTHTHFDRVAMHQAAHRWGVEPLQCTWLDSARVARRTWAQCARSGYGLADVCALIGHEFEHHDALEDAKAAGQVLLAALLETGFDLEGMLSRVGQPVDLSNLSSGAVIKREGNPEGSLFGHVVVFTGALNIARREAADLAASIGCEVTQNVSKKTTLLVVGDMDLSRLAGHDKSSKHRRAEELAAQGVPLRIIRETDFRELVALA